jgi:hypothetical protein
MAAPLRSVNNDLKSLLASFDLDGGKRAKPSRPVARFFRPRGLPLLAGFLSFRLRSRLLSAVRFVRHFPPLEKNPISTGAAVLGRFDDDGKFRRMTDFRII